MRNVLGAAQALKGRYTIQLCSWTVLGSPCRCAFEGAKDPPLRYLKWCSELSRRVHCSVGKHPGLCSRFSGLWGRTELNTEGRTLVFVKAPGCIASGVH